MIPLKRNISALLQNYSKFSFIFLIMNNSAKSEVIYTDLEPDIVLNDDLDNCILDLNNDSNNDFKFLNRSFAIGGYWTSGSIYYIPFQNFERLIGTALSGNSFAGNTANYGTTFSSLIRTLPFALSPGVIINELLTFQPDYQQLLAFKTEFDFAGEIYYYGGNWFPEMFDRYLGVKFDDTESKTHYGWIRCDVLDEGRTLIIKDYAYEEDPDYPIISGDTAHFVSVNEFQNNIDATVYSVNKSIFISLNKPIKDVAVRIFDVAGKEVYIGKLLNKYSQVDLSGSTGIYIVKLFTEENILLTQKVIIHN